MNKLKNITALAILLTASFIGIEKPKAYIYKYSEDVIAFEKGGTFTVDPTTKGTKYLVYVGDNAPFKTYDNITVNIGDGKGTYVFEPDKEVVDKTGMTTKEQLDIIGNDGIVMVHRSNNATINGNLEFNLNDARSSVQTYGMYAYQGSKITLNGNFKTYLNATAINKYPIYNYGLLTEANSNININGKLNITGISSYATNNHADAYGVGADAYDGNRNNDGSSYINITCDETSKISNISAKSTEKAATAYAVSSNGVFNAPDEFISSEVNFNCPLVIDNIKAEGTEAEAIGISASTLGKVNINKDLEIKNINSSNKKYALYSLYGGIININQDEKSTVKIDGDIESYSYVTDESTVGVINLNLTNKDSYLKGASTAGQDAGDDYYGAINLTLKNKATWYVKNPVNSETNDVTLLTLDNGIIDLTTDSGNQIVSIDKINNANGTIIMNIGDTFNVTDSEGTNKFKIKLDISSDDLDKLKEGYVISTTNNGDIEYTFDDIVVDGITYKINVQKQENQNMIDWIITPTKIEKVDDKTKQESTINPQTSDNIILYIIGLIVISALVPLIIIKFKRI